MLKVKLTPALRHALESRRLERRLTGALEELERRRAAIVELVQSKNDLIAALAHDIKGPLTSIVGFAELLEEGYLEGDGATDAAKTIKTNAQRLATLANDVVALSRVEYGDLEIADDRVNLVEILEDAIQSRVAERPITFERGSGEAIVRGDSARLRQVFDNLIGNAIKYSPGGEPVAIALRADEGTYALSIRDSGIGVPEEEMPKLFQRFSRASNARRAKLAGTGIGLFIVKRIVDRHGGTIDAASTAGEGSTFTVVLPTIEAAGETRPGRVTILSTYRHVSRFAAYELRLHGYRVREVDTLDEVNACGDFHDGDVVVADSDSVEPAAVRRLAGSAAIRLVGVGAVDGDWDATLPRPFLLSDLLAAVKRETGGVSP